MINIGTVIINYSKKNNIPISKLASMLHMTPAGLYRTLNQNNMKLSRLGQISKALNHNFFEYFTTPIGQKEKDNHKLKQENEKLAFKLTHLQTENTYLKEINELLKAKHLP